MFKNYMKMGRLMMAANEESGAAPVNVTSTTTPPAVDTAAIERARSDERQKLHAAREKDRKDREELEKKLADRDQELEKVRRAGMSPDQQVVAQLDDLRKQVSAESAKSREIAESATAQVRAFQLIAYKERALRHPDNVNIDESLVFGTTEQEIDHSIENARRITKGIEDQVKARFEAQMRQSQQPQHAPPQGGMYGTPAPVVASPTPPQNPAYVQHQQYPAGVPAGYPTPTQPLPITEVGTPLQGISDMTTEQAVRSGKYGGGLREQALALVKGMQPGQSLGVHPRHFSPVGTQQMPNGVQQPVGLPMGPAGPVQYQQAPVPNQQPGAPQAVQGNAGEAMAAAQRTHNGQNPIANQTASGVLNAANQHGQQVGLTPQQAFAQRFQQ